MEGEQAPSVDVLLKKDWDTFTSEFHTRYTEAQHVAEVLTELKNMGQLNEVLRDKAWEDKPVSHIVVPHPMLYAEAVRYSKAYSFQQMAKTLHSVLNKPLPSEESLHAAFQEEVDTVAKGLTAHESSHFGSGLSYLEPSQIDLTITLGIFLVEIEGVTFFYVDIAGGGNKVKKSPRGHIKEKIYQVLAPDDPSDSDFAKAIKLAQQKGYDISGYLRHKGYPNPEEGKPKPVPPEKSQQ